MIDTDRPAADTLLAAEFGTLPALVAAHAAERGAATAIVDGDRRLDYAALDALVDRAAAAFGRDGCAAGEAVAICAATSADYLVVFLGALRAGLAPSPLAPSSTGEALDAMIRDAGARLLFLDSHAAIELKAAGGGRSVRWIALDEAGAGQRFADWLAAPGTAPAAVAIAPADPFNIIYSSGTTGAPKGIVQSHAMRWSHIRRGRVTGYAPDAVTMVSTPLYSNTTLVSVVPALAHGGTLVLMAKFDARRFLDLAERHRATHAMLVPVQYQRLLADPGFDAADLSSFRMKTCTSGPFAAALKAEVLRRWSGGLVEIYGMTEGGGTMTLAAHLYPDKLHTVGRPVEGHVVRLIDDAGREVPAGEAGEVVGHSPAMMTGYHDRPEQTRAAEWFDAEGRRYIRTGDIGRFDADGFLTLIDRKKDMIISGGFNIYPSDLEAVLAGHPDVREAAVVGVPSPEWGETPVAFVVLSPSPGRDAAAVRRWVNERVGRTQRLHDVMATDELPRSAIGKVLKRDLARRYALGDGTA